MESEVIGSKRGSDASASVPRAVGEGRTPDFYVDDRRAFPSDSLSFVQYLLNINHSQLNRGYLKG